MTLMISLKVYPTPRNEKDNFLRNASLAGRDRRLSMSHNATFSHRQALNSVPNPRNEDGNISRNASLDGCRNMTEYNEIQDLREKEDFKGNPDDPPQRKPLITEISSRRFREDEYNHVPAPHESNDDRISKGPPGKDFCGN